MAFRTDGERTVTREVSTEEKITKNRACPHCGSWSSVGTNTIRSVSLKVHCGSLQGDGLRSLLALKGFPGGSVVNNLPAMQEMQVRSLDQENLLEKGRATHSSILAYRIPWTEELKAASPWGCKDSDTTEQLSLSFFPSSP